MTVREVCLSYHNAQTTHNRALTAWYFKFNYVDLN